MGVSHRSAVKDLGSALYTALSTTTFTALSPVYLTYAPPNAAMPYTVIQSITETPGWECMGSPAKDCSFQLHVASRGRGEAEAADILTAGAGIVMRGWMGSTGTRLTVANHTVGLMEFEGSDGYDEDVSGFLTFHRVGRFRVQLCQST